MQQVGYDAAAAALARPRVQELWQEANRAAHEQLVALLEGETERVQRTDGAVVLTSTRSWPRADRRGVPRREGAHPPLRSERFE